MLLHVTLLSGPRGSEPHPLRSILSSHLHDLSRRKWGFPDFTWVITKGGSKVSRGSPTWQNICCAWGSLKQFLNPVTSQNLEKWHSLPLWSQQVNHINAGIVRCSTRVQHQLRHMGLHSMGDVLSPMEGFLPWAWITEEPSDWVGERAYL